MNLQRAAQIVTNAALKVVNDDDIWTPTRIEDAIQATLHWAMLQATLIRRTDTTLATIYNTVTVASWSGSVVTLTVGSGHGHASGDTVNVTGISPTGYNGRHVVTGTTGANITYALTTDPGTYVSGGAVGSYHLDMSGLANFNPALVLGCSLDGANNYDDLEVISWVNWAEWYRDDTSSGQPRRLAYRNDGGSAFLHPAPDAAYTLHLDLKETLLTTAATDWTPPAADQSAITMLLPDRVLMPILRFGVPAMMQADWNLEDAANISKWNTMLKMLDMIAGDYGADGGIDVMRL